MKLNILGASGSGVTTTGQALAGILNVPYVDSDEYFWELSDPPFTVRRSPAERNFKVKTKLDAHPDWILGGSVYQWGKDVFPDFDLVVFLWIPPEIRMERLKKREFQRYGNIIYENPERNLQFEQFLAWAADYDVHAGIANRTLQAHENWLSTLSCPVLTLSGDMTISARIDKILEEVQKEGIRLPF